MPRGGANPDAWAWAPPSEALGAGRTPCVFCPLEQGPRQQCGTSGHFAAQLSRGDLDVLQPLETEAYASSQQLAALQTLCSGSPA